MASRHGPPSSAAHRFLLSRGAAHIPHLGGTLLAHVGRTARLLSRWGACDDLVMAGLCHATYGTDGFDARLLDVSARTKLADLIGLDAEAIVYLYASCDRRYNYVHLGDASARFRDRFTGDVTLPPTAALRDFAELTFANELDLVTHSEEFRERDWPTVARVFSGW